MTLIALPALHAGCEDLHLKGPVNYVSSNKVSATQFASVQPAETRLPILSAYEIELGEPATAEACADPNTRYEVALAGVSGSVTTGELAAAREALSKLKDADMLLLIHSAGKVTDGKSCGTVHGRGVRLRAVRLPEPANVK